MGKQIRKFSNTHIAKVELVYSSGSRYERKRIHDMNKSRGISVFDENGKYIGTIRKKEGITKF